MSTRSSVTDPCLKTMHMGLSFFSIQQTVISCIKRKSWRRSFQTLTLVLLDFLNIPWSVPTHAVEMLLDVGTVLLDFLYIPWSVSTHAVEVLSDVNTVLVGLPVYTLKCFNPCRGSASRSWHWSCWTSCIYLEVFQPMPWKCFQTLALVLLDVLYIPWSVSTHAVEVLPDVGTGLVGLPVHTLKCFNPCRRSASRRWHWSCWTSCIFLEVFQPLPWKYFQTLALVSLDFLNKLWSVSTHAVEVLPDVGTGLVGLPE